MIAGLFSLIAGLLTLVGGVLVILVRIAAWIAAPFVAAYLLIKLRRWGALLATFAVIAVWGQALLDLGDRQRDAIKLGAVTIARDAKRVALGRLDFFQNPGVSAADEQHVEFIRDPNKDGRYAAAWSLANVSTRRKLLLAYCIERPGVTIAQCRANHGGTIKLRSDRVPVESGDVVQLSSASGAEEELRVRSVRTGAAADPPRAEGTIKLGIGKPGKDDDRVYDLAWSPGNLVVKDTKGARLRPCIAETVALVGLVARIRAIWRPVADETILLRVGGTVVCATDDAATIDLRGTRFSSVSIGFVAGVGFVLARDVDAGARISRQGEQIWLGSVPHPLVDQFAGRVAILDSFVAGRTRYAIESGDPASRTGLRIMPVERSHRLAATECLRDASIDFVALGKLRHQPRCARAGNAGKAWRAEAPSVRTVAAGAGPFVGGLLGLAWTKGAVLLRTVMARGMLFAAAATAMAVAAMLGLWWIARHSGRIVESGGRWERFLRWTALVGAGGVLVAYVAWKIDPNYLMPTGAAPKTTDLDTLVTAAAARQRDVPEAPWSMLITWGLAAVAIATARGGAAIDNLIMTVATAIVALGHCALVTMSLDSGELSHLRFADDTTHAVTAAAAAIVAVSQIGPHAMAGTARWMVLRGRFRPFGLPLGLFLVGLVTFAVLVLWFVLGTETGIAEIVQPSELVKTLVVILLAASVTLVLDPERDRAPRLRATAARRADPPKRRWRRVTTCAAAMAAAAAIALGRVEIARIFGHQWVFEIGALVLALTAVAALFKLVDDPLWSAFLLIAAIVAVIGAVPLFRNDLSAFLVIITTAMATLGVVVAVHWVALWSQQLEYMQPNSPPPPASWRLRPPSEQLSRWRRIRRWGVAVFWTALRLPKVRPFELAAAGAIVVFGTVLHLGAIQLVKASQSRELLVDQIGSGKDKPINRFISWVELNAQPDEDGRTISVEFADVGLQVLRSRKLIAASRCDDWRRWLVHTPPLPDLASVVPTPVAAEAEKIGASVASSMADAVGCATTATAVDPPPPAPPDALSMPEIQNDFIGSWLVVSLGRAGALELVFLQCALIGLMVFSATLIVKFKPAHVRNRAAASAAAFATVGFAMMLAVQWTISWANAFGIVPVMGQPATFLSHGPSHFLLFGLPALLAPLCALRLRSALTVRPDHEDIEPVPWRFMVWHWKRRTKRATAR